MYRCILVTHKLQNYDCAFLKTNSIVITTTCIGFSAQDTRCSESWHMCRKNPGTSTQPQTPLCTAPGIQNTKQHTVSVQCSVPSSRNTLPEKILTKPKTYSQIFFFFFNFIFIPLPRLHPPTYGVHN